MILLVSLSQFFSIGLPVIGVVALVVFLVKDKKKEKIEEKIALELNSFTELKKDAQRQTLPLRLSAYERLILFVERISPTNLFLRISPSGLTAMDMHAVCSNEIRNEFEHNLSQQLYVSETSWKAVKRTKDETLLMLHTIVSSLPADATGIEYSRKIFEYLSQLNNDIYADAGDILRADMSRLF